MGVRRFKAQNDFIKEDPTGQISRKLREYYDSVKAEPIPDRFLDLLEQLDAAEAAAAGGKSRSNADE
ncbi:MAG: hypothetical protein KDJ77_07075 [Rhodobiaceae bacterium]|nr:hypothetical protein [Rhodobiaceae bacterium]